MRCAVAFPENRGSSGVVLVITLLMLATLTILLLALFAGASHQILSAQSAAVLARERILADSSAALVIGQIEQASTQTNVAWISQPGLLRIYGTNAVRAPIACYKLYSTASLTNLVDTSGNLNFLTNEVPANWTNAPSLYTDLNSPARTLGGATFYPILDPAALTNQVTGVSSDLGTNADAVPMPVAWIYELQDGTLGPASNATAANPIVARIAFWTDDDTCKIDINTSGCGTPWNTPRVNSTNDAAWSTNQPAAGEYSAYPGHPATTSLAAAFTNVPPQQLLGLSPRYAWGGSQFGSQPTTPGEVVPQKTDRLYASVDELCFSTNIGSSGQRMTNAISASQLETARFVLTAHSVAPETTLLGEPRVAIWPIADSTSSSAPRLTADDNAITNAATVGAGTSTMRSYFFQRGDPQNAKDDFDPASTNAAAMSNVQMFNDLLARGQVVQPGYGASLSAKYPGAAWTQLLLEIADFIHGLNAVDPSPSPFVPFAAGDSTGAGHAFVLPLTTTYGTGTNAIGLRGLGRCPTFSGLTLVCYVSGFTFKNGSYIDYQEAPDDSAGTSWKANFLPASTNWANVTGERVRAFVVPSTFQPGCGYPEVSDACTVQVKGLDTMKVANGATQGSFGFTNTITSRPLSDALKVMPADRAWGGNEGPLGWRAAALDAQPSAPLTNAFAGTNALVIPLATAPTYKAATGILTWPAAKATSIVIASTVNLTCLIQDAKGNTLQTINAALTSTGFPVPTPVAEYGFDGSGNAVMPSYYMSLNHRALLTGTNREFCIQPGDTSRGIEAATDLRVIAALTNVPASMFKVHPSYGSSAISHAHNLHFADGTAAFGASGLNTLFSSATYAATTNSVTWTDWTKNASTNYAWPVSPRCSCPTTSTTSTVTMAPAQNIAGDWDTGPGLSPDGAEIALPDAGTTNAPAAAYFSLTGGCVGATAQRTPNALVPSPVIFGSLPAGLNPSAPASSEPWRTLLFCPYPAGDTAHPGFGNATVTPPIAPDHLILDNFWMPVVEPYPISTCLATAGKINLNDQIAPFTYLHRSTALHALLGDLRIPAIPVTSASTYKSPGPPAAAPIWNPVDENATIAQIESRFAGTDAYLSESEICTVPLVPVGQNSGTVAGTKAALDSFWNGYAAPGGLTGDNLRELPYALLYGRLTTRSNSYTVHVRVQVLQKLTSDPPQNVWNEGVDLVLGEWRGSYAIERYLDPAAPAPAAGSPLGPYKYRILSARRFAP